MADTIITHSGNLTADPELSFTHSGVAVVSFTIANTPRSYNKTTQQWEDGDTLFLRCTAWRDLAENIAESLTKGLRVIATGKLKQRTWEKDGQKRSAIEMEVEEIGPSLKNATAKVTRLNKNGGGPRSGDAPF